MIPGQEESIEEAKMLELKWPPNRFKIESEYFQRMPHDLLNGSLKRAGETDNSLLEDLNEEFASADRLAEKELPVPTNKISSTTLPVRLYKETTANNDVRTLSKSLFAENSKSSESSSLKRSPLPWQLSDKTPAFGPDEKEEIKQD